MPSTDPRNKLNHAGSLSSSGVGSFIGNDTEPHQPQHSRRYPQKHVENSDCEDIPGSPTPMLSEENRNCFIRTSMGKLPARALGYQSTGSLQSSPPASSPHLNYSSSSQRGNNSHGSHTLPSHSSARLTLSMNDCEGPYRVKKAEQHQQLLKTFSSPRAGSANVHQSPNSHPAWRKAKGLDTSWRSASSLGREDDDNTTTSGSYTINPDELREDLPYPDIMV